MTPPAATEPPAGDADRLDARTVELISQRLLEAVEPSMPQAVSARLKRRVLHAVAALPPQETGATHRTMPADGQGWQPFAPGIAIKVLHEGVDSLSYLLRLQPGAELPPHRHPQDEECVVLDGVLRIGEHLEIRAGGFHLARGGSLHGRITSDTGATVYLRGAPPQRAQLL